MKAHTSNPILKRLKQENPYMFEGTLAYTASFRAVRINCKILSQQEKKNRRRGNRNGMLDVTETMQGFELPCSEFKPPWPGARPHHSLSVSLDTGLSLM